MRHTFGWSFLGYLGGLGLLLSGAPAAAHEAHSHAPVASPSEVQTPAAHAPEAAGITKITGEVVDMACYLSEGAMGPGHRECAEACIKSGLPVGIKTQDQVYLAMGSEHGPANATLAPLAAKQVEVEGIVSERDGVHLIAIKKVTVKEASS